MKAIKRKAGRKAHRRGNLHQELASEGELGLLMAIRQKTKVPDALESVWENVNQGAADKLFGGQSCPENGICMTPEERHSRPNNPLIWSILGFMPTKRIILAAVSAAMLSAIVLAQAAEKRPLRVVPSVDLARYAGQWYEIARLPNRFQKQCAGEVTANYTLESASKLTVVNRCRLESGSQTQARGVGRVAEKGQPNSMLKVRFAPAFLSFIPQVWGDYQIIVLSPDYSYALVGDPGRAYLWILSRSAQMDPVTYEHLVEEAQMQGFDVRRLQRTRQSHP